MSDHDKQVISIVLPLFNEQNGILQFQSNLVDVLRSMSQYDYEIIYCNDGSNDDSLKQLNKIAKIDNRVRIISLTRNFGKEIATTAGIQMASGDAIITLDSDGQHPVELIGHFIKDWESGTKVVVGLRYSTERIGFLKRLTSKLFYKILSRFTGVNLMADSTDYRLIDKSVQTDFNKLTERNRITRGLIDWLGYDRTYVTFKAKPRMNDYTSYSYIKLLKLAVDSLISLSNIPLYLSAYIGAVVLPVSFILGLTMFVDKLIGDPFNWHATGGAYVLVLVLFLIGILLMSQGFIGLYLTHIHSETQNRPLYIVDKDASTGL